MRRPRANSGSGNTSSIPLGSRSLRSISDSGSWLVSPASSSISSSELEELELEESMRRDAAAFCLWVEVTLLNGVLFFTELEDATEGVLFLGRLEDEGRRRGKSSSDECEARRFVGKGGREPERDMER